MCNGHADTCDILDPKMPNKLVCRCQHNTCGAQCATCCRGFEQKKWRQSTAFKKFTCERKNNFSLSHARLSSALNAKLVSLHEVRNRLLVQLATVSATRTSANTVRKLTRNTCPWIYTATTRVAVCVKIVGTILKESTAIGANQRSIGRKINL